MSMPHIQKKTQKTWKFLLVGITGDLSRKKILPGIAQFAKDYADIIDVELYGYSRSQPDDDSIRSILDEHGAGAISSVEYVQGEYADNTFFHSLVSTLQDNQRLVVYLAVPPHVFVPFLQNSCPYSRYPIDILIEKPFGTSSEEADRILQIVHACDLGSHVHFCDHYLFKNGTFLPPDLSAKIQQLDPNAVQSITVQALESVGVEGRAGYYDNTGALKDMFPHMYSLLQLIIEEMCGHDDCNRFANRAEVTSHIAGQFASYLSNIQVESSATDTYFDTHCRVPWYNNTSIDLRVESGKKLAYKSTAITVDFTNGDSLVWEIQPNARVIINGIEYDIPDKSVLDHNRTFQHIHDSNNNRFVSRENIIQSWNLYEEIKAFQQDNAISTQQYQDGSYPMQFVDR